MQQQQGKRIHIIQRNVLILYLALFFVCAKAKADDSFLDRHEVSISWSFYTAHWSADLKQDNAEKFNNNNNIFVLSIDQWFVSTFVTSFDNRAYALGYTFRTPKWQPFNYELYGRANLQAGVAYGYEGHNMTTFGGCLPGILPSFEVGYKWFSIEILVNPLKSGFISSILKFTF